MDGFLFFFNEQYHCGQTVLWCEYYNKYLQNKKVIETRKNIEGILTREEFSYLSHEKIEDLNRPLTRKETESIIIIIIKTILKRKDQDKDVLLMNSTKYLQS